MRVYYEIVKSGNGYNAYAPIFPGFLAAAGTLEGARKRLLASLPVHIKAVMEDGESMPSEPVESAVIEVDVPTVPVKRRKAGGDLLTTSEAAAAYGKTRVAWRQACERGSIPGAVSKGGIWLIPRAGAAEYGKSAKRGRPAKSAR